MTGYLIAAGAALLLTWAVRRYRRASRLIDQLLADARRQRRHPARYARSCADLGACTALLRGDDEQGGGES